MHSVAFYRSRRSQCCRYELIVDNQYTEIASCNKFLTDHGLTIYLGCFEPRRSIFPCADISGGALTMIAVYRLGNNRVAYLVNGALQVFFIINNTAPWYGNFRCFQQVLGLFFIAGDLYSY